MPPRLGGTTPWLQGERAERRGGTHRPSAAPAVLLRTDRRLLGVRASESGARDSRRVGLPRTLSGCLLALSNTRGEVAKLDVHPLRRLGEHPERFFTGQVTVVGLDDADGLADDLTGLDRSSEVRLLLGG